MSATTTRQCDDCGGSGVRTIEGKRFACPRCLTVGAYEVAPPDGRVNFDTDTEAEAEAAVRQAAGLDAPAAGEGEGER